MKKLPKVVRPAVIALSLLTLVLPVLAGCVSSRIESSIENGDDVNAIRMLSDELCKKSDNVKYATLFTQVYPYAVETRYPTKDVDAIILECLASYGHTPLAAVRNCAQEVASGRKLSSHAAIASAISRSESLIQNLKELVLIQRYVAKMPAKVGNAKKGVLVDVYKYTDDFSGMLDNAVYSLADLYYSMGEVLSSYTDLNRMEERYSYYAKADSYVKGIYNLNTKAADCAYAIGMEYQTRSGTSNKKTALSWFQKCLTWVPGYAQAQNKVYEINYLIGMEIYQNASSLSDYEEALNYMNQAGTYLDAQTQVKEISYQLAYAYKAKNTSSYYRKAGDLFSQLGNYKNASYEATLYEFYKKLSTMSKGDSYGNIRLSTGNEKNRHTSSIESSSAKYTNLNASLETSKLNIYTNLTDNQIFPGLMFEGNSIAPMRFTEFNAGSRAPLNYQIVSDGRRLANGTITNPASRTAGSQIKTEISRYTSSITPTTEFEFIQVYSPQDLELALGFGYGRNNFNMNQGLFYNDDTVLVVKINQTFYEAKIDAPSMPYEFFNADSGVVNKSSLYNVTPYYVSSVTYGRSGYFVITSELSAQELIQDLEELKPKSRYSSSYTNTLDARIFSKWVQNHTYVTSISVGEGNYLVRNYDGIYGWISSGYQFVRTPQSLAPISFTLRNLYSNDYAILSQSAKVQIENPNYNAGTTGTGTGTGGTGGSGTGTTSGTGTASGAVDNAYTSIAFVGASGTMYPCRYRDSTTYYYDIKYQDLAYCRCTWNPSEVYEVRINSRSIEANKTLCDFSTMTGSTISFDYIDVQNGYTHKLLVINAIN